MRNGDIGHLDADGYFIHRGLVERHDHHRRRERVRTRGGSALIGNIAVAYAAVISASEDFCGEFVKAIVVTIATEIEPNGIIEFLLSASGGLHMPANLLLRSSDTPRCKQ